MSIHSRPVFYGGITTLAAVVVALGPAAVQSPAQPAGAAPAPVWTAVLRSPDGSPIDELDWRGDRIATGYGSFHPKIPPTKVLNAADGSEVFSVAGEGGGLHRLALSPDGKRLATADNSWLMLFDVKSGRRTQRSEVRPVGGITRVAVAFSGDGKHLLHFEPNIVRLWDVEKWEEVWKVSRNQWWDKLGVAFRDDPGGTKVLLGTSDAVEPRAVVELDAATGKEVRKTPLYNPKDHGGWQPLRLSPDGKHLAMSTSLAPVGGKEVRNPVALWDTAAGKVGLVLDGEHPNRAFATAFSPDGKHVACVYADGTFRMWDRGSGKVLGTVPKLVSNSSNPRGMAFSPDGSRVAIPDTAQTDPDNKALSLVLRVWEVKKLLGK